MDQVDAKGNVSMRRSFIQDDHKNEGAPQVLITRSLQCGTPTLQAQESPTGPLTLRLHSHHDYNLGKRYFQDTGRMTVRLRLPDTHA